MGDDFDWTNPEFWTDWDKNPPVTDYGWDDAMQDLAESGGLKPSDFAAPDFLQKAVDALKKLGGKAADFVSSPQGIMSLVGAAANYVDRQRPSGGGTTMAYQGPAELKRKMVQGPYGPVAEYEGVGGGAPDYTRFAAPTVREPAPAPEEPDYAELLNIVRGLVPKETAAPATAPKTTAPIAAPGQKPAAGLDEQPFDYNKNYGIPFDMRYRRDEAGDEEGFTRIPIGDLAQEPIFQILESASPQAKAQEYNRLRNAGFTDAQIREQAGSVFGPQSDEDWQALRSLAGETAARATGRQTSFDDPFVTALREAMGETSTPFSFTDPTSKSTITTKTGYTGVPYEYTFMDQYGKSETIAGDDLSAVNKLAQKYKVDLSKAFAARPSQKFDASKYAVVGQYGMDIPLETIYSSDVGKGGGLTFRSLVEGPKLGSMSEQFYDKPLQEVESVLKKYKQTPPKTEQELIEANSAWSDYSDRFRNSRNGEPPLRGGFDSSLAPIKILPKKYEEYGSLNDLLSELSQQVSQGTQNELGLPNTREAELLNSAITILDKNPIIAQTIDRIKQLDPNVKINSYDIRNLNARIAEAGTAKAVQDFIAEKRNMVGFYDKGSEPFFQRHTMADPTYRAYSNLLNEVSSASASNVDQSSWEAMAKRTSAKNQTPVLWRDPNSGQGIGMILGEDGQPKNFTFYGADGTALTSSVVSAPELYKKAELFGIDLSGIGELGNKLDKMGVKYKPNELYAGSDAGVDLQDIARGGMGSAFDWTKDPMAHLKGPSAISSLATNQALAQRLGVGAASGVSMGVSTAAQTAAQPASQVTTQPAAQLGAQPAAQPVAQAVAPRNLMSLLPSEWGTYTGAEGAQKKIDWFNQQKATEAELRAAGVKPKEIAWMRQNKLGTYAQGGPVRMEDGAFVMTKRAVDGAGGPRGIQQLVPGARMIKGPGHGTSDSIPAYIQGRNGRTPARLSNGEAYVPPGRDTDKLYALMKSLERNA